MTVKKEELFGEDLAYWGYIQNHIGLVQDIWYRFSKHPYAEMFIADDFNYFTMKGLIDRHDQSKVYAEEFYEYRRRFYPKEGEIYCQGGMDYAWNHHQKANPHHWEYWVLIEGKKVKAIGMPLFYLLEMLIDWTAMSVYFKNAPSEWFENKRDEMLLHESTVERIEQWLPTFNGIYKQMVGEKDGR